MKKIAIDTLTVASHLDDEGELEIIIGPPAYLNKSDMLQLRDHLNEMIRQVDLAKEQINSD